MELNKKELTEIVQKIMESEGTEKEIDEMIDFLEKSVTYPGVSDLIFWNEDELSVDDIVNKVLNYKKKELNDK